MPQPSAVEKRRDEFGKNDIYTKKTMNNASRWRRAIADRLAAIYAHNPYISAVLLGGSTARGHADQYSDIELGIFWYQPPTDEERRAVIELAEGDLIRL